MEINKVLKVLVLLLAGVFVVFEGFGLEVEGAAISALALVLLTVLYCKGTNNANRLFFWFLVIFTFAHLLSYSSYYVPDNIIEDVDYFYYAANILYMVSYVFLIIMVLRQLDLKKVFLELPVPIFILLILDIFCVLVVTGTAENMLSIYQYALELIYNAVIMTLLSVGLINYMYRNDNKSMLFLIGSICIVFSEIIQLAYYYIIASNDLGFIYSFFLVVAFLFYYLQSQLAFTGPEPEYTDEHIIR